MLTSPVKERKSLTARFRQSPIKKVLLGHQTTTKVKSQSIENHLDEDLMVEQVFGDERLNIIQEQTLLKRAKSKENGNQGHPNDDEVFKSRLKVIDDRVFSTPSLTQSFDHVGRSTTITKTTTNNMRKNSGSKKTIQRVNEEERYYDGDDDKKSQSTYSGTINYYQNNHFNNDEQNNHSYPDNDSQQSMFMTESPHSMKLNLAKPSSTVTSSINTSLLTKRIPMLGNTVDRGAGMDKTYSQSHKIQVKGDLVRQYNESSRQQSYEMMTNINQVQASYSTNASTRAIMQKSERNSVRSNSPVSMKEFEFDELNVPCTQDLTFNHHTETNKNKKIKEVDDQQVQQHHNHVYEKQDTLIINENEKEGSDSVIIETPRPLLKSSSQLLELDEKELLALDQYQMSIAQIEMLHAKYEMLNSELIDLREILHEIFAKQQDIYLPFIVKLQAFFRGCLTRKLVHLRPWHQKLKAKRLFILTFPVLFSDCEKIGFVYQQTPLSSENETKKEHDSQEAIAAIKIQSVWRSHMVRYRCEKYSIGYYAALQIQTLWRGYRIRNRYQDKLRFMKLERLTMSQEKMIQSLQQQMNTVIERLEIGS